MFPHDAGRRLQALNGPRNDIRSLRAALVDPLIGLYDTEEVATLVDGSKAQVEAAVETFFREGRRDDQLFLYYSGHGWPGRREGLYLCVHDTNTELLASTAVAKQFLEGVIDESPARATIIMLDCCHSGNFKGVVTPYDLDGEGRFVITSARPGQVAADALAADRVSPFTELVVEALRDADIDGDADGLVTVDELFRYVSMRARELRLPIPQRNFQHAVDALAVGKRPLPTHDRGQHALQSPEGAERVRADGDKEAEGHPRDQRLVREQQEPEKVDKERHQERRGPFYSSGMADHSEDLRAAFRFFAPEKECVFSEVDCTLGEGWDNWKPTFENGRGVPGLAGRVVSECLLFVCHEPPAVIIVQPKMGWNSKIEMAGRGKFRRTWIVPPSDVERVNVVRHREREYRGGWPISPVKPTELTLIGSRRRLLVSLPDYGFGDESLYEALVQIGMPASLVES